MFFWLLLISHRHTAEADWLSAMQLRCFHHSHLAAVRREFRCLDLSRWLHDGKVRSKTGRKNTQCVWLSVREHVCVCVTKCCSQGSCQRRGKRKENEPHTSRKRWRVTLLWSQLVICLWWIQSGERFVHLSQVKSTQTYTTCQNCAVIGCFRCSGNN